MKTNRTVQRLAIIACTMMVLFTFSTVAYAAPTEPIEQINRVKELVLSVVAAIGVVMLIFGIVQLGMSMKSHDPSQRSNSFLIIGGSILIIAIQPIVSFITG